MTTFALFAEGSPWDGNAAFRKTLADCGLTTKEVPWQMFFVDIDIAEELLLKQLQIISDEPYPGIANVVISINVPKPYDTDFLKEGERWRTMLEQSPVNVCVRLAPEWNYRSEWAIGSSSNISHRDQIRDAFYRAGWYEFKHGAGDDLWVICTPNMTSRDGSLKFKMPWIGDSHDVGFDGYLWDERQSATRFEAIVDELRRQEFPGNFFFCGEFSVAASEWAPRQWLNALAWLSKRCEVITLFSANKDGEPDFRINATPTIAAAVGRNVRRIVARGQHHAFAPGVSGG